MPSIRYMNQTAPFWDFVANLEDRGASHPFFNGRGQGATETGDESAPGYNDPWAEGWAGFPWGPFPHHGRRGAPPPPPPPGQPRGEGDSEAATPQTAVPHDEDVADPEESVPVEDTDADFHEPSGRRHGRHHGPWHHQHRGHHGRGAHRGRSEGGRGHRHGRGGAAPPFPFPPHAMQSFGDIAAMFQNQFVGQGQNNRSADGPSSGASEFTPEVDVFDTTSAFVVHVSLAGAKKEDIGVHYDSEKSELVISGVVHRPGDEELLRTLALDERRVGMFERKIRLGSRANPAQVDVESMSAKMEDGILRVEVPKIEEGFVEVRKVDIQ